jgi:hypothetical protein
VTRHVFKAGFTGGLSSDVRFRRGVILKVLIRTALLVFVLATPALAEKLVDPAAVPPEYREAAEQRRAEQIRQHECAKKADVENVMPRERTAFLLHCLEVDAAK